MIIENNNFNKQKNQAINWFDVQYLFLMLVAIDFSSIVSSAVANDDQLGPPFSLTLSSPLNQADIHSQKQSAVFPL